MIIYIHMNTTQQRSILEISVKRHRYEGLKKEISVCEMVKVFVFVDTG